MRCGYDSYPNILELIENGRANTEIGLHSYMWGITIDQERFKELDLEVQQKAADALASISDLLPEDFNINSKKQLATLLYDTYEEPIEFLTETGSPQANKEALNHIRTYGQTEEARRIAVAVLEYNLWMKRMSTYVKPYRGVGLIRPRPNPGDQVSGRWGYRAPALQTWPKIMKPMFVAGPGNVFTACDLSQAELRVIALLSNDEPLLEAYNQGKDVHTLNAQALMGIDMEDLREKEKKGGIFGTPESKFLLFRNCAKTFAFCLNYSTLDDDVATISILSRLKAAGISQLGPKAVRRAIKSWWRAHPAIREYKERLFHASVKRGYVEDVFSGRRRNMYGRPKDTEIFNFPLQAAVATIMDKAVQEVQSKMDKSREGLIVQVHDCLVIETYDKDRGIKMLMDAMHKPLTYKGRSILMAGDPEFGTRYGKLEAA